MGIQSTSNTVLLMFLRRLWLPFASFAVFLLFCVLTYSILEGIRHIDALYWIFHPHAIHYEKARDATKIMSLVVSFGVLAFHIWIAERVLTAIFRKEGKETWKTMVNEVTLSKISDHFIICGYGEVGRTVVEHLRQMQEPFVLIDKDETVCKALMLEGFAVVQGDASRKTSLRAAGIERARGICILIDNDSDNLYITIMAKGLNPNLRIITRAGKGRYARAMQNSGADEVIIPEYEGGILAGKLITKR